MTLHSTTNKATKFGVMCTKCFKKKEFDVDLKINSSDLDCTGRSLSLVILPYFKCSCDIDENMENIDIDIIDDIVTLNKAGYLTSYCCSSHNDNPYGLYVVFKDYTIVNDIGEYDITTPKYLYFEDWTNDNLVMRVNRKLFTKEDTESDRMKILEDFHTFVSNLIEKR